MVLDKFNMVDMGDIDIIESQGVAVEGLYQRLVESITLCRYQCLYNWKFNGILIPPSYVEMEVREDGVWINEGVMVDEENVVHIYSIEPEPPAPIEPEIEPLTVSENGEYYAPVGVDGYNPVIVTVPSTVPVIQPITIKQNGMVTPPAGVDGYSPITVNVPSSEPAPRLYWDLTESLVDQIEGATISLSGGAVSDSEGVSLPSASSQLLIPYVKPSGVKLVLEVGETSAVLGSNHLRFVVSNLSSWNSGLIYRSTGEWSFYTGSVWDNGSGITDINFFDNSKVTIEITYNGLWKIYKDDVLVYSPSAPLTDLTKPISIGASSQSYYPSLIKSIKVF